jgi:hypothetical protein
MANQKPILGKVEPLTFVGYGVSGLPAKVDTGAYRSSIWATGIREEDGILYFKLLGPGSEFYTGEELSTTEYERVKVENSFGHSEERYSVFLKVEVGGKKIRSNFTLANRAAKTYAALIGRKMLNNRFMVDVSCGQTINEREYGDDSLL